MSDTDHVQLMKMEATFFALCNTTIKFSIALFMSRLHNMNDVWQKWLIWIFSTISALFSVGFIAFVAGTCVIGTALHCDLRSSFDSFLLVYSLCNALTDIVFMAITTILVSRLTLSLSERFGTWLLVTFGAVGSIGSILRCAIILGWDVGGLPVNLIFIAVFSYMEVSLTITATCCATLRPLFRWVRETTRNVSNASSDGNHQMNPVLFPQSGGSRRQTQEDSLFQSTVHEQAGQTPKDTCHIAIVRSPV
ncbi:Hypothetical protein D9617_2g060200 [Elsinoe fawcettii]|nr:Hypothetical protein D9617_2g060200 [Elsinoe fawcettii]